MLGSVAAELVKFFFGPGNRLEARRDQKKVSIGSLLNNLRKRSIRIADGSLGDDTRSLEIEQNFIQHELHQLNSEIYELFCRDKSSLEICRKKLLIIRRIMTGDELMHSSSSNSSSRLEETLNAISDAWREIERQRHNQRRYLFPLRQE